MEDKVAVIILAAGSSSRMGKPKVILPWEGTTIIGRIIDTFSIAGIREVTIITGGDRKLVESYLQRSKMDAHISLLYNPNYLSGGMLSSIQVGLGSMDSQVTAAFIALGDQPQVKERTIRDILTAYHRNHRPIISPTCQGKRGHPWLLSRSLWSFLFSAPSGTSSRHFFESFSSQIEYVPADESILKDLDTPEEYDREKP
jgi:molybdenum cofactor cytidylyltransferase